MAVEPTPKSLHKGKNGQQFGSFFGIKGLCRVNKQFTSLFEIFQWALRGLLGGKAASLSPHSLTPSQPQPPIRLKGLSPPYEKNVLLVCKVITKLEPTLFYLQFRARSQGTSGPAQLLHTGAKESEGMPSHSSLSEASMLLLISIRAKSVGLGPWLASPSFHHRGVGCVHVI